MKIAVQSYLNHYAGFHISTKCSATTTNSTKYSTTSFYFYTSFATTSFYIYNSIATSRACNWEKKNRHSTEFKAKILSQLEKSSQADLARLYKIDRRLVGNWSKPANKEKILNVVGKRHTFRIGNGSKSWWPELENELFGWFKQQRQKGACVSDGCFKVQASVIFDEIYRNTTVAIPPFAASNGWLENFLKRKNLRLNKIYLICNIY